MDIGVLTTTVAAAGLSGLVGTVIGVKVTLGTMQARIANTEQNLQRVEVSMKEGLDLFRLEATELRKAVNRLTEVVSKHGALVDGMVDIYERLRNVETDVAVLKSGHKQ